MFAACAGVHTVQRWLDDVNVGDLVEVVPLCALAQAARAGSGGDDDEEGEAVEERVQVSGRARWMHRCAASCRCPCRAHAPPTVHVRMCARACVRRVNVYCACLRAHACLPHPTRASLRVRACAVQGIVDEVMTDDMFQTQGVLVRLQEDNTMGHVARVLSSKHRQRQQEWPSLLQGTGVARGVCGVLICHRQACIMWCANFAPVCMWAAAHRAPAQDEAYALAVCSKRKVVCSIMCAGLAPSAHGWRAACGAVLRKKQAPVP